MKIKNLNEVPPQPTPVSSRPAGNPKETGPAPVSSSAVTLSDLSAKVAEATNALKAADGGFDAGRVAEVRQRLDEGRYAVDAEKIADAMIKQSVFSTSPPLL
ncbi:MAG: flagellar biosynthesis anti-sigma factor FlgM [Betaproteobacteria bacterium]|nr:flagellar biosynthesis anti-sigma factor FlgM [Betaproteobacteria bacterium]